ncbi:MAG TPA: acylphosphatase [Armatimonadota bacterium]|nr:acylphosphatase [Armatimonadota bacterium]
MQTANDSGPKRLVARVSGRVQGVGFRQFVRHEAEQHALTGAVRNREDGSVEVVAEGTEASLGALLAALARGPVLARVERIESRSTEATGEFARFEIRR